MDRVSDQSLYNRKPTDKILSVLKNGATLSGEIIGRTCWYCVKIGCHFYAFSCIVGGECVSGCVWMLGGVNVCGCG